MDTNNKRILVSKKNVFCGLYFNNDGWLRPGNDFPFSDFENHPGISLLFFSYFKFPDQAIFAINFFTLALALESFFRIFRIFITVVFYEIFIFGKIV